MLHGIKKILSICLFLVPLSLRGILLLCRKEAKSQCPFQFLKYSSSFLLLIILGLFSSCTQPMVIKYVSSEEPGHVMYGKVPQRNFYENTFINEKMLKLWTSETNGSQANTSVIIYDDYLFVTDLSGRIYAYDKNTGKRIGYEKYKGAISIAPIINKLRIYYVVNHRLERYSTFYMRDFTSGKTLSEVNIEGSVNNEMIRTESGILILTDNGEHLKINYGGTIEWAVKTKTTAQCNPASDGKIVVWGTQKGELIFASSDDGKIIYKNKMCEGIESGITIDNNVLFFGDITGKLYAYDYENHKIIWSYNTGAKIKSTPVFNSESVFIGNLAGNIFSIDKLTGKRNWKVETKGVINTTPLLVNNFLIQPDYNKKIHFINPIVGQTVHILAYDRRVKLSPVYYDGIIYTGSDRGEIHAYKADGELLK